MYVKVPKLALIYERRNEMEPLRLVSNRARIGWGGALRTWTPCTSSPGTNMTLWTTPPRPPQRPVTDFCTTAASATSYDDSRGFLPSTPLKFLVSILFKHLFLSVKTPDF